MCLMFFSEYSPFATKWAWKHPIKSFNKVYIKKYKKIEIPKLSNRNNVSLRVTQLSPGNVWGPVLEPGPATYLDKKGYIYHLH